MASKGITLAVVLDHITGLASCVHTLERRFGKLEKGMGSLDQRMDSLEKRVGAGFAILSKQLHDLEYEDLPRRVSRLEDKVFSRVDC